MPNLLRVLLASRSLIYAVACILLSGLLISFRNIEEIDVVRMFNLADTKKILLDVFGIRISFMVLDRKQTMFTNLILFTSFSFLCYVSFYQYDESMHDLVLRIWVTLCIKISSYLIKILSGISLDVFLVLYPSILITCSVFWKDYKVLGIVSLINFLLDATNYFQNLLRFQWNTANQLKRGSTIENTYDIKVPLESSIPLSEIWKVEMGTHIAHLSPVRWDKQQVTDQETHIRKMYLVLAFESEDAQRTAQKYLSAKSDPFCKATIVTSNERDEYMIELKYPHIIDSVIEITSKLTQSGVKFSMFKHEPVGDTLEEWSECLSTINVETEEIKFVDCLLTIDDSDDSEMKLLVKKKPKNINTKVSLPCNHREATRDEIARYLAATQKFITPMHCVFVKDINLTIILKDDSIKQESVCMKLRNDLSIIISWNNLESFFEVFPCCIRFN